MIRALTTVVLGAALASAACAGGGAGARRSPEETASYKVQLAQSLFNAGRLSEAMKIMDEAIAREPGDPSLRHFRGQLHFRAGRWAEAEADFAKTLELDPYFSDAHNFLGAVYQEQKRFEEAERYYRTALENPAYPTPEKVYLNLGLLYAQQERQAEAVEALRRAVEINPRYYQGHFELASLLDRMGKLPEAAREYEVAEPGYSGYGDYHYRLGFAYFRLGQRDKARQSLARVLEVAPGSESAARAQELLELLN
jgi:Tfp pilus assembly protein PilF